MSDVLLVEREETNKKLDEEYRKFLLLPFMNKYAYSLLRKEQR